MHLYTHISVFMWVYKFVYTYISKVCVEKEKEKERAKENVIIFSYKRICENDLKKTESSVTIEEEKFSDYSRA